MLIIGFIVLFRVTTRTGLYASMLRNTSVFSYSPVLQRCIPPLSEALLSL